MRDLYKHLGIGEGSGEAEIRAALVEAPPDVRQAAEFILLDPARRAVYDRNRRVLVTVGRLRANLGLNLTQFWPRPRFADFTISLAPVPTAGAGAPPGDPVRMAWAFGVSLRRDGTPSRRGARLIPAAIAAVIILGLAAAWWYWARGT